MIKVSALLFALSLLVHAQLTINYVDPEGEGFKSMAMPRPEPTNPGTTLGEQRRLSAEAAVEVLRTHLQPAGPVEIQFSFADLNIATVAEATPGAFHTNDTVLPLRDTTYPGALANHIAQTDLSPNNPEVIIRVGNLLDLSMSLEPVETDGRPHLPSVLLHEILHGLGFRSNVTADGSYDTGFPNPFTRNMFFLGFEKNYPELTQSERALAAAGGDLTIFTGENTRRASTFQTADGPQTVLVRPQESSVLLFEGLPALFGPSPFTNPLLGRLVMYDDGEDPVMDGCTDPTAASAAALQGNIALMERGRCVFFEKVRRAQAAGATGVIILNNRPGLNFPTATGVDTSDITIPTISAPPRVRDLLLQLANTDTIIQGEASAPGTSQGRPFLHTPQFFQPGSSLSHWASTTSENLLMRPVTNNIYSLDPGLAFAALRDIGWAVRNLSFPSYTYETWAAERNLANSSPNDDADNDGITNLLEFAGASDPTDPNSCPIQPRTRFVGGQIQLTLPFNPSAGLTYQLQRSFNLTSLTTIPQNPFATQSLIPLNPTTPTQAANPSNATTTQKTITLTLPTTGKSTFFRQLVK